MDLTTGYFELQNWLLACEFVAQADQLQLVPETCPAPFSGAGSEHNCARLPWVTRTDLNPTVWFEQFGREQRDVRSQGIRGLNWPDVCARTWSGRLVDFNPQNISNLVYGVPEDSLVLTGGWRVINHLRIQSQPQQSSATTTTTTTKDHHQQQHHQSLYMKI